MKKVYNVKLLKKMSPNTLTEIGIHWTWADKINRQELYTAKSNAEGFALIMFKQGRTIMTLELPKELCRDYFQIVAEAKNEDGLEIARFINQPAY